MRASRPRVLCNRSVRRRFNSNSRLLISYQLRIHPAATTASTPIPQREHHRSDTTEKDRSLDIQTTQCNRPLVATRAIVSTLNTRQWGRSPGDGLSHRLHTAVEWREPDQLHFVVRSREPVSTKAYLPKAKAWTGLLSCVTLATAVPTVGASVPAHSHSKPRMCTIIFGCWRLPRCQAFVLLGSVFIFIGSIPWARKPSFFFFFSERRIQ